MKKINKNFMIEITFFCHKCQAGRTFFDATLDDAYLQYSRFKREHKERCREKKKYE